MRARTFNILILLVIVSVAAAAYIVSRSADDPRFEKIGQPVFPGLIDQVNDISELNVAGAKGSITIRRTGKSWRVVESRDHPANPKEVFKAIVGIAELKYFEPKTERVEKLARLRLDDPSKPGSKAKRLTLKVGDRVVADVVVGREKSFLPGLTVGGVYFRLPNESESWLARGNPEAGDLPKDWLAREIVNIDGKRVKSVTIRHADNEIVQILRPNAVTAQFVLSGMPSGMKIKYASDLESLGAILEHLEMDDARHVTDRTIDWSGSIVAEVETFDGVRAFLETVNRDDIDWLRIRVEAASLEVQREVRDIMKRTSGWVYMMPKYEVVPIRRRMRDLLVPEDSQS